MPSRIIVFTRYPEPGRAKTRLIPLLGAKGAAALQRKLTEHVVSTVRRFSRYRWVSIEIRYNGGCVDLMSRWLGDDLLYRRQVGTDLGDKMSRAFRDALNDGFGRVVIVGADIPDISVPILETALDCLADNDLVLGPASDGGYYLIGLRELRPQIFRDILWGSCEVFQQTLETARYLGLSVKILTTLDDVDNPEDILKLNVDKWINRNE